MTLPAINRASLLFTGEFEDDARVWSEFVLAANYAGLTILATQHHYFYPQGLSGVILLAESHIAIHTWPEQQLAWVELATCGGTPFTDKFIAVVADEFQWVLQQD